jgi:hypothetical protein
LISWKKHHFFNLTEHSKEEEKSVEKIRHLYFVFESRILQQVFSLKCAFEIEPNVHGFGQK